MRSRHFEVIGINGNCGEYEIKTTLKCNACGSSKEYTLHKGKAKFIKCSQCNNVEVAVPRFEVDKGKVFKSFELVNKHWYLAHKTEDIFHNIESD